MKISINKLKKLVKESIEQYSTMYEGEEESLDEVSKDFDMSDCLRTSKGTVDDPQKYCLSKKNKTRGAINKGR